LIFLEEQEAQNTGIFLILYWLIRKGDSNKNSYNIN